MGQSEERVGEQVELKIFSKSDTFGDCMVYIDLVSTVTCDALVSHSLHAYHIHMFVTPGLAKSAALD